MKHQLLAPKLLMDITIIESNGHNKVENVPHTLGDTIKLLKSSTDALKPRINMYPNAHFESRPILHATGASSSPIHARLSNGMPFDVKYAFIVITRAFACLLIRLTT
ncbi:hypothetical protein RMATCC62417_17502 [Rhizopus microsporus]|nr:hypothetical protein RMATCC62417_17502 [Rhizopus microsporus]